MTFQVTCDSQKSPHNDISGIFGQLILIPKNLPKTTDCRKKYIGQNLHKMTFQKDILGPSDSQKFPQNDISSILGRSILIPKTTDSRKKYIGQNIPKMTFRKTFQVASDSQKSPQNDIQKTFQVNSDSQKSPQNDRFQNMYHNSLRHNFHGSTNMEPESPHNDIFFMYCELTILNLENDTF